MKEKPIARCKECKMEFSAWISDNKICPECDGEVEFITNQNQFESKHTKLNPEFEKLNIPYGKSINQNQFEKKVIK